MARPRCTTPPLPRPARRRWLAALLLATTGAVAVADQQPRTVEVWLDLSEQVPATAADESEARRRADRVARQQRAVAAELQRLGATELARVRHARNAIAVRVDADRLDALRAIPGVRRVRPVRTLHPPKPAP